MSEQSVVERSAVIPLDEVCVLLVDDDEEWTWVTARLLEQVDGFTVATEHDLSSGRERFDALDPDCVVCDYHLGDGDGLDLLQEVRSIDPDRPFVLVTGKGDEGVAADAIRRGVTDYVRKGREDEDELLTSRVRTLVRTYRSERALERQRRTASAALEAVRGTSAEADLPQEFCRRLVDADPYRLAWLGVPGSGDSLLPRASAGANEYVDAVGGPDGIPPAEPARRAMDADARIVESLGRAETESDGWRAAAAEQAFDAVVAVPVRHDGVTSGVLAVYLDAPATDPTIAAVRAYAESVGHALRSLDRKRALLSDRSVRLEVTVADQAVPLVALADRLPDGARISCPSIVVRDDGTTVYVARVRNVEPAAVERAADDPELPTLAALDRAGDDHRCRITTTNPTPEGVLGAHGARFDRTIVADGAATITATTGDHGRIHRLSEALRNGFDDSTISTVWTDDSDAAEPTDPFDDLTTKQRTVLAYAYHEGYFERPRGANATDVAERLGISRQTFAQHLRAAQRKVFGTWQAVDDRLRRG